MNISESPPTSSTIFQPSWLTWASRMALWTALILMVFHFVVYGVYALSLLTFPFDYDQGEGFELNDTILLSQGQSPYRDNEAFPFYASNYPPLYHVILIPFAWLFGAQYWYGRLIGFTATLITGGAIAYAVYRETRYRPVSLLAGMAFFASNYIYHIGPLFRQHISMVMLETLAVVVIASLDRLDTPENTRARRRIIRLSLLLLLMAGFTKQLAIITCGAVLGWLLLRGVKRAILYSVGFGFIAGGIFLLINLSTEGQWWINIIAANVNGYIMSQFTGLLSQFVGLHGAILIPSLLLVLYELYVDRLSVYSVWFVAAAVGSALAGKWGAGDSYFATLIAATCVLAGIFTGRSLRRGWRVPSRLQVIGGRLGAMAAPLIGLSALCLFCLYGLAVFKIHLDQPLMNTLAGILKLQSNTKFSQFYDGAGWTMGYATIGQIPSPQDTANGWQIVALVKDDPRPILSEEAAFSFRSGKPVITNPTQLLNLYNNGLYDPAALVKMVEAQAFGAVIFRARFYPPPILEAVDRAYKVQAIIPMNGYEYTILIPNPEWNPR